MIGRGCCISFDVAAVDESPKPAAGISGLSAGPRGSRGVGRLGERRSGETRGTAAKLGPLRLGERATAPRVDSRCSADGVRKLLRNPHKRTNQEEQESDDSNHKAGPEKQSLEDFVPGVGAE